MCDNEDEEEIKIEYLESLEEDPLSESSEKQVSNYPDENINQRQLIDVKESLEKHESTVKHENNYTKESIDVNESLEINQYAVQDEDNETVEQDNEESWYKPVDEYGRYPCKFCDRFYSTLRTVRIHVSNKHFDDYIRIRNANKIRRSKLKCHICKTSFKLTKDLKVHVQIHGINNIQKSCSVCHAMFDNKTEMLSHMSKEHATQEKLHLCFTCGYSTSKISHFKQHEKTHTGENQKKCPYCEYTTNREPNLKIHVRIHTNKKPYSCDFKGCDYRCAAKSALYSHRLKHEKEKNMLYCDKCSYSTVYKQSLKKHMDSHRRNSTRTKF